jgi:hypothetical protein
MHEERLEPIRSLISAGGGEAVAANNVHPVHLVCPLKNRGKPADLPVNLN